MTHQPLAFHVLSYTHAGGKRSAMFHRENQDRVMTREFAPAELGSGGPALLLAVADGVSRCVDGGAVADWLISSHLGIDPIFNRPSEEPSEALYHYLRQAHRTFLHDFGRDPGMLESGSTLSVALVHGDRGSVLWSGDSPVYQIRTLPDGNLSARTLTFPDRDPVSGALTDCFSGVTPFGVRQRRFEVSPGDIVIAATDGLAYDGETLAFTLAHMGFTEAWLHDICERSQARPGSDDVAVAAVQITAE